MRTTIEFGLFGPTPVSPADPIVEDLLELGDQDADGPLERCALIQKALDADPGCIPALVAKGTLPGMPRSNVHLLAALREAVRVGSRLWAPVEARYGDNMAWWDFAGTRDYMRAIHQLGLSSEEAGDLATATHCFEALLRMNDRDPLGVMPDYKRVLAATGAPDLSRA